MIMKVKLITIHGESLSISVASFLFFILLFFSNSFLLSSFLLSSDFVILHIIRLFEVIKEWNGACTRPYKHTGKLLWPHLKSSNEKHRYTNIGSMPLVWRYQFDIGSKYFLWSSNDLWSGIIMLNINIQKWTNTGLYIQRRCPGVIDIGLI